MLSSSYGSTLFASIKLTLTKSRAKSLVWEPSTPRPSPLDTTWRDHGVPTATPADIRNLCLLLDENIYRMDFGCPRIVAPPASFSVDISFDTFDIVEAYLELMTRPWFLRSWTIQEFCLSQREPLVLSDGLIFFARALYLFSKHLRLFEELEYIRGLMGVAYIMRGASHVGFMNRPYLPDHISTTFPGQTLAQQLLWLLLHENRHVSQPHDRIYSLLGLIDSTALPPELTPDYRKTWDVVCREYTR